MAKRVAEPRQYREGLWHLMSRLNGIQNVLAAFDTGSRALSKWLHQSNTWPSAVLIDEFDAGILKGPSDGRIVCGRH
jgi:hypothetical protein